MKAQEILDSYEKYIMPTYTRTPLIFVKGKGMKLWDIRGKEYLDFFPGWGVSSLGHCHPAVMAAVRDQIGKLIHLPNNLYHPHQVKLAKEIVYWSYPAKVFFCNSGAEANEAAIKFARAYGSEDGRFEIITFRNSFHGRTLATLAATGQEKYKKGFEPLPEGFKSAEYNDIESISRLLSAKTAAVLLELIQGEGGINVARKDFLRELRAICDRNKILLIIDEVQTGMGRTGKMFAFQNYDIRPDAFTLAKALGGGLPIGALVVKEELSDVLQPGMHASTFGGSPVVSKAALAVFKAIQKEKLLTNVGLMSEYLFEKLQVLKESHSCIQQVRGMGLMIGIQLAISGKEIVEGCMRKGLLINCTHDTVLRLMPALNVTEKQINKAIKILDQVLSEVI
jgi:acetylornithine/N-succinyldiaminopimelate aminotransferase